MLLREKVLEVALQLHLTQENAQNTGILRIDLRFREAESWRLAREGARIFSHPYFAPAAWRRVCVDVNIRKAGKVYEILFKKAFRDHFYIADYGYDPHVPFA